METEVQQKVFILASKDFILGRIPYKDATGTYKWTPGQLDILGDAETLRNHAVDVKDFSQSKNRIESKIEIYRKNLGILNTDFKTNSTKVDGEILKLQNSMSDQEDEISSLENEYIKRGIKTTSGSTKSPENKKKNYWTLAGLLILIEIIVNLVCYYSLREFLSQDQVWMRIFGNITIIGLVFFSDFAFNSKTLIVKRSFFIVSIFLLLSSIFTSALLNIISPIGQAQDMVWDEVSTKTSAATPWQIELYRTFPCELILCVIIFMILLKVGYDKKPVSTELSHSSKKAVFDQEKEAEKVLNIPVQSLQRIIEKQTKANQEKNMLGSTHKQRSEALIGEIDKMEDDLKGTKEKLQSATNSLNDTLKHLLEILNLFEKEYCGLDSHVSFATADEEDVKKYFGLTI
ncbi:MAG: hypothetical protein M0Q53_16725 [Prolixibacteraceae bacterium]|jgi:hypothetical protein|nr:hypothetical protein [Prolixibacteraceae bacterium]